MFVAKVGGQALHQERGFSCVCSQGSQGERRGIKSESLAVFVAKSREKTNHQERGFSCVCSQDTGN